MTNFVYWVLILVNPGKIVVVYFISHQFVQFNLDGVARMFGTAVFSLEGVGAVLILRNDLKERQDMSWYVLGHALSLCVFVSVGRVHVCFGS